MTEQEDKEKKSREQELKDYVIQVDTDLETDVAARLYGLSTNVGSRGGLKSVGYKVLREFFEGDQWNKAKPNGGIMRTYNYCATTVFNYTAFLAGEPPEFDVPPADITDEISVAVAETQEEYLIEVLKQNSFSIQWEESVMVGSELGDSYFIGPFYNKSEKRIWFSMVKKPEFIRPIFSTRDYNEIVGFIHHYRVTKAKAEELWGDKIIEKDITLNPTRTSTDGTISDAEQYQMEMIDVMQYWDKDKMILMLGDSTGKNVIDYDEHHWGFVPLLYVKNIIHPNYPHGISDIETMLDAQVEYNESASYASDVLRAEALPHIFGKNLDISEFSSGVAQIIDTGDDSELFGNPMAGSSAPWELHTQNRQKDIYGLSGINEIMYGGPRVREATGRALSVLMQGVQNRIKGRQERWRVALKHLAAGILRLTELYVPGGKELVQGRYEVDIFFPSTLMRNVAEEINKFNNKLQSQTTTMKNIGVPSPVREKKLIIKELDDKKMAIEISRNAQLSIQLEQILADMQAAKQQREGQAQGGEQPEGEPGENPTSAQGVPTSTQAGPEGAVNQSSQQGGAPPMVS